MSQKRTPDSIDPALVDQLCDLVISKLEERARSTLTFNQGVVGSNPTRLTSFAKPSAFWDFLENQGVISLGLPTP